MEKTSDFLRDFTISLKNGIGDKPTSFFYLLDFLKYFKTYNYEEEKEKIEEINKVLDKIISIIYRPHFHTDSNRVVLRSDQAGKLSHDLFTDTLREPSFWKEKNNQMVPEYAYSYENVDNIDIYENRFISYLIDELEETVDSSLENAAQVNESLDEYYQNNQLSFGQYSFLRRIQRMSYPYVSFSNKTSKTSKELVSLIRRTKRTIKNLNGSKFYTLTSKKNISSYFRPTNILTHDNLYSYCYRYYCSNYKKNESENINKDILYFNYFFTCLVSYLKEGQTLNKRNTPKISFDENDLIEFKEFAIKRDRFSFSFKEDKENLGIYIETTLHFDERDEKATYYLAMRDRYNKKASESIDELKGKIDSKLIVVTENNILKDYDSVITFNHFKKKNKRLFDDLFSLMSILISPEDDTYSSSCPVCGKTKVIYDGNKHVCQDCHSEFIIHKIDGESLTWISQYRKEC